ncbi:uncharacterized protein LOC134262154 [Saccostrea cucullata]|uniref:uncharacterized protein LOC134262154 n=1 Tax=Saccostrea cuccullata TaxID=36930 RepID=UPI002ED0CF16
MSFENDGSSSGGRCYVDNAYNRRLGRVGMPHGSMVVSSGGRLSSESSSFSGSSFLGMPGVNSGSGRLYVDNSYNRALGRVGMPHGSMVVSSRDERPSAAASHILSSLGNFDENYNSGRSYVDNSYNRALGRVGMPHGSMVVSSRDDRPSAAVSHILSSLGNFDENYHSGRSYVDNSYNRSLGRVGMPHGSMTVSSRDDRPSAAVSHILSSLGKSDENYYSGRSYVDNSFNRALGRVGMPHGSMEVPESTKTLMSNIVDFLHGAYGVDRESGRSYVENCYIETLGRDGMSVSSKAVSSGTNKQSPTSSSLPDLSSLAITSESRDHERSYVDNSYDRTFDRDGMPMSSKEESKRESSTSSLINKMIAASKQSSTRPDSSFSGITGENRDNGTSHEDNSYNRTLGRVDMPLGSKIESSERKIPSPADSSSSEKSARDSDTNERLYVDNSYNRTLGRVGMPLGSMKTSNRKSRPSSASPSSAEKKSYVDNAHNRKLDRVGKPVGSMPVFSSKQSSASKTYVDNEYNRKLGRVGVEHGSMVVSKSSPKKSSSGGSKVYVDNSLNRSLGRVDLPYGTSTKVENVRLYKDNAFNRRLGRVGKPVGTAVQSKSGLDEYRVYADNSENRRLERVGFPTGSRPKASFPGTKRRYCDNALNRALGRVGEELGTRPVTCSKETEWIHKVYQRYRENPKAEIQYQDLPALSEKLEAAAVEKVMDRLNRVHFERKWRKQSKVKYVPKNYGALLHYTGPIIKYSDLEIGKPIGRGGFGVVYHAMYKGSVVAVKKLPFSSVPMSMLKGFNAEINILNRLDHPYIVKFIGACISIPDLCIVMEYMQMSLHDALHVDRADLGDFTDEDRLNMIKQTLSGLKYLHDKNIAHCDIKPGNILIDHDGEKFTVAKLSDFGLSMMSHDPARCAGTPRYSSPEILRGEFLNLNQMMMSDMYSYGLVVFEIICEKEPFANLSKEQLQIQVGRKGLLPQFPEGIHPDVHLESQLLACWDRNPANRPTARSFLRVVNRLSSVYATTDE